MSNVVTMAGNKLTTMHDLLKGLIDREDVAHVVVVIERKDGMTEVQYDRQTFIQIVYAAACLNAEAMKLAAISTVED